MVRCYYRRRGLLMPADDDSAASLERFTKADFAVVV